MILNKKFFNNDTILVAQNLLGKVLVRRFNRKLIKDIITEVEVYDGFYDLASHASRGETPRNKVMFGPAGYWYIYLVYGVHFMLNVVTREKGYPAAILIRGTSKIEGPARLTKFFNIDKDLNGLMVSKRSGLWVEDEGLNFSARDIKSSSRIGVGYAGPVWSKKKWRFYVKNSKF